MRLPVLDGFRCSCLWMSTCTAIRVSTGGNASQTHQRGGWLQRGQRAAPASTTLRPMLRSPRYLSLGKPRLTACQDPSIRPPLRVKRTQLRSRLLVCLDKVFSRNRTLAADYSKSRRLDRLVVWESQRRLCTVRILPNHRDVLAIPDNLEAKSLECRYYSSLRSILWELGHQSAFTSSVSVM